MAAFVSFWELYPCSNRNLSTCQVRSCLVSSGERATSYGDFKQSSKVLVNIGTNTPHPSGHPSTQAAQGTEHGSHFTTYSRISWLVYLIPGSNGFTVALLRVVVSLYSSSRNSTSALGACDTTWSRQTAPCLTLVALSIVVHPSITQDHTLRRILPSLPVRHSKTTNSRHHQLTLHDTPALLSEPLLFALTNIGSCPVVFPV